MVPRGKKKLYPSTYISTKLIKTIDKALYYTLLTACWNKIYMIDKQHWYLIDWVAFKMSKKKLHMPQKGGKTSAKTNTDRNSYKRERDISILNFTQWMWSRNQRYITHIIMPQRRLLLGKTKIIMTKMGELQQGTPPTYLRYDVCHIFLAQGTSTIPSYIHTLPGS